MDIQRRAYAEKLEVTLAPDQAGWRLSWEGTGYELTILEVTDRNFGMRDAIIIKGLTLTDVHSLLAAVADELTRQGKGKIGPIGRESS